MSQRPNNHTLVLKRRFSAGHHSSLVRLRPNRFDASTLDVRMKEFPSGRTIVSRGWDLDHIRNRMAVPVFTAFLDGRELGDVWFDVPNYQDGNRGLLDTEFGFRVEQAGEHELRLVVLPADRSRFGWDMVESIRFAPDDRREAPLAPRLASRGGSGSTATAPWLFLHGRTAAQVRAAFRQGRDFIEPLRRMERLFSQGHVVPYIPNEQIVAAAAFLTESPFWLKLARQQLCALCAKPTWSIRPNPRLMGGDNDGNCGQPLMSVAMLAHYLWDQLDEEERSLALGKAREYGRKLYEFSVLQKRYAAGMGDVLTHESGTLVGQALAAMVFWNDIPESPRWLAWAHGRMLHALATAPRDGRCPFLTYGGNYVVAYAAAVKDFAGVNLFGSPYLRNLPRAILRCHESPANVVDIAQMGELMGRWILGITAAYTGDAAAAWGWHQLWDTFARRYGATHFIGWPDLLFRPSAGRPPQTNLSRSHLFKDVGMALMSTGEHPPRLSCVFQSGLGSGRAGFRLRNRYGMEMHGACADGAITVTVRGVWVMTTTPGIYRKGFANESAVTVNGDGHYMEGRWLGCRPKASWLSRMISFRESAGKTDAVGDNTGAYREELGVTRSRRRVTLLKSEPRLVIEDAVRCRQPHQLAVRYQCTGVIEKLGPGRYRFTSGSLASLSRNDAYQDVPLQALELCVENSERYCIRIRQAQMVLPYIYGMNMTRKRTKGIGTAPPPRPWFLEIALARRAAHARFHVELQPLRGDQ